MRLTWLILHREQRHRCAPDAECPYLVITGPHAGHLGVFIPPRWNNHLQCGFSRTSKPKSRYKTNTFCPSFKLAPTNFNTDFPVPTSQKGTIQPTRFWPV